MREHCCLPDVPR
jgi:hypothetical protein